MLKSLGPSDYGDVVQMLQFLREESPEYRYAKDDPAYVLMNMQALGGALFGVIDPGRGAMVGVLNRSWYSDRLEAVEQLLFVYPPYRGTSLAVRMVKMFEDLAAELGAKVLGVGVTTGLNEERTVGMYKRLGFRPKGHSLSKEL